MAVSYYLFPVDIQSRAGWREWLPAPTLGFGLTKPQDNVYLGFAHEPWRNVQLFWGWHWGMDVEEVTRYASVEAENKDATAPPTRERRQPHFAWGVSFNIAVIAKVFK